MSDSMELKSDISAIQPSTDYNSLLYYKKEISNLSFCRFTRRYWGNPCWFLFLRLLICLSSAGNPTWFEVDILRIKSLFLSHSPNFHGISEEKIKIYFFKFGYSLTDFIARSFIEKFNAFNYNQSRLLQFFWEVSSINKEILQDINKILFVRKEINWYLFKRRSNKHTFRNTKRCNVRSKIRWFTKFCNSHYLSHFAAFFIDARTKRSVVESCNFFNLKILNYLFK